jgi:hypothetical protein
MDEARATYIREARAANGQGNRGDLGACAVVAAQHVQR